jgi:hypothetical protein
MVTPKHKHMTSQKRQQSSLNTLAGGFDKVLPASTPDAERLEKAMANEREQVVKDLLIVLGSIDMVNMEPNGDSFVRLPSSITEPFPTNILALRRKRSGKSQVPSSKFQKNAKVRWLCSTKTTSTSSSTFLASWSELVLRDLTLMEMVVPSTRRRN